MRSVVCLAIAAAVLLLGIIVFNDSPPAQAQSDRLVPEDSELAEERSPNQISPSAGDIGHRLIGTAVSDDPRQSIAVMEDQFTGKQGIYREKDPMGDFLIKKILHGKVVLKTDTGDEVLSVGSGRLTASPTGVGEAASLTMKEVMAVLPDQEHLMREIRVRPHFEAGQPDGFVIYNIALGSIFERMGLKDGDVIESINGEFFMTTQPVMEFYDALLESGTVALEIIRDDKRQGLLFEIQ